MEFELPSLINLGVGAYIWNPTSSMARLGAFFKSVFYCYKVYITVPRFSKDVGFLTLVLITVSQVPVT